MISRVEIVYGEHCLERFSEFILNSKLNTLPMNKPILLKPNMLNDMSANDGVSTDYRIVDILAKYFVSNNYKVVIGDGGVRPDTIASLIKNGYSNIKDVELIDLNKGEMIPKQIGNQSMFISKIALESSVISIAKLKVHSLMQVTLTLKNLMGCVNPKGNMHDNFVSKIEDVYEYIKPVYGIVDGIIGNLTREDVVAPVVFNTILAGNCCYCVDKVGSIILKKEAQHIENLLTKYGAYPEYDVKEVINIG